MTRCVTCSVTGTLVMADGTPIVGAQVLARPVLTADDQGGQVAGVFGITSDIIEAYTDDDGEFEIDLMHGLKCTLEIPTINLRKVILIPAVASIDFGKLV